VTEIAITTRARLESSAIDPIDVPSPGL
jgi:NitT/TauT family transport system substrate-binding protein